MNIEMALKSRSYILDLDHVKLSEFSELFNRDYFTPAFRTYFYFFVKNHTPKRHKFNVLPNFTCGKESCLVT